MGLKKIIIHGARVHNLKNIHLEIPKEKFVVVTGISGSGKSSLVFDTLYAEGQRRYVESLSSYARQFLGLMEKPDVDYIEGLSPAIAIERRKASKNPRSTVATVTEIYDYLRLLFARIGIPHCPHCGVELKKSSVDEIIDSVMSHPEGTKIQVLSPVVRGRKGEYRSLFEKLRKKGFVRVRVDGEIFSLDSPPELDRYKVHKIDIVVDRLKIKKEIRSRLADSIEQALKESDGFVRILSDEKETMYSEHLSCPLCGFFMPELEPRLFSFNSPYGACPSCSGLGVEMEPDPTLIVPDPGLSITQGALKPYGEPNPWLFRKLARISVRFGVSLDTPWKNLPQTFRNVVLYGNEEGKFDPNNSHEYFGYEGVIPYLWRRYTNTDSDWIKEEIEKFMIKKSCPVCKGARLRKEALSVKIRGYSISDIVKMSVQDAHLFFEELKPTPREFLIAKQVLKELKARLGFLLDVGVGYLTLDRPAETLSGGEDQRVRLATQIGSGLTGVLYLLDEPTIGLHPRDTSRLLKTLLKLRNIGNTVIVSEHDEQTIRTADWIVDLGPLAGESGGEVVVSGTLGDVLKSNNSLTGKYLSGKLKIPVPKTRRKPGDRFLVIHGVKTNNLKNITVSIPLGLFVCVTGVSGSGKSSLIEDTLYPALKNRLYGSRELEGKYEQIEGIEYLDKVINIDQSPIGRTPRSNPATYTGVFTPIRELFASLPESKVRGYPKGRFSFNVRGGRCEACEGSGYILIEMQFLPDVHIPCEVCKGKRYNRETLEIRYKGLNIADVLSLSVDQAAKVFKDIPQVVRYLKLLQEVGLGYIKLGQPATTLSGGEAQRIKLAKELSKRPTGRTLYLLDEPTVGLHFHDIKKLIGVLQRLVEIGNTVIVIEHNLDIVKSADWIIDLGPEGGDGGGYLVAQGPPEVIANTSNSTTGRYLKKVLPS